MANDPGCEIALIKSRCAIYHQRRAIISRYTEYGRYLHNSNLHTLTDLRNKLPECTNFLFPWAPESFLLYLCLINLLNHVYFTKRPADKFIVISVCIFIRRSKSRDLSALNSLNCSCFQNKKFVIVSWKAVADSVAVAFFFHNRI